MLPQKGKKRNTGFLSGPNLGSEIESGIGSYTHGLAKYLSDILKPLAYNEFTIKDSFSFANDMLSISSAPFMCSFDVVSLYTNILVDEAIDICLNKLYCNDEIVYNLTRSQLKKLLNYCVKQNHFAFNDNIYDQIDGVAMGSPLVPSWQICPIWKALLYMNFIEINQFTTKDMLMIHF